MAWRTDYGGQRIVIVPLTVPLSVNFANQARRWPGGPGVRTPQLRSAAPVRSTQIRGENLTVNLASYKASR